MSRLHRDVDGSCGRALNIVLVFHGLTMRVFLTRWFKWTTAQFEGLNNPVNCEVRVMQLGPGGEYSLAGVHSKEEMEIWGLTPTMIQGELSHTFRTHSFWDIIIVTPTGFVLLIFYFLVLQRYVFFNSTFYFSLSFFLFFISFTFCKHGEVS